MSAGVLSLRPRSLDSVLGFWAQELGVNVPELMAPADGVTLTASSALPGIFLLRRGHDLRIGAAVQKLKAIHDVILGHTFRTLFSAAFWKKHPALSGQVIGPAMLFYLDAAPASWKAAPPRGMTVRGLSAIDAKPFADFIELLTPMEREHSGLELGPRPMWGAFRGKELLAVAGYDCWPGRIAHLGVAVHPEHRQKKFGQLVVQAASRGAMTRRRIVQYRTLAENAASVALAKSLDFAQFGDTLYVRPPESSGA